MEAAEKYFVHAKEILYMEAEKYVVPPKGNTRHLQQKLSRLSTFYEQLYTKSRRQNAQEKRAVIATELKILSRGIAIISFVDVYV